MVVGRKVSAAVKRLAVGSEKRGKRPAALSADGADRDLVAAVDVGTLVAIHLHRHEMLIHDLRNFGIVIRLAVHHMTPVAPDRADVEQDGLVLALRGGKGLLAPLMPLDGLVHGGAQIGGRSLGERVEGLGGHGSSVNVFRVGVLRDCGNLKSGKSRFSDRAIQIHRVTQLLLLDVFALGVGDVNRSGPISRAVPNC